jgi:D-alanine-D-alanine ligase
MSKVANAVRGRTIGPVADLEPHVPPDWWRTMFGAVYLATDGDVVENDANTRRDVDVLVRAAALRPDDRVLDLCCGQGRHSIELARRGFTGVVGLDRSRYLVRLARKRALEEQLDAAFHEGDARRFWLPGERFDCVAMLGNSFGYFDRPEDDLAVLTSARDVLRPGGMIVLDVPDGPSVRSSFEPRSWEWIDDSRFVCRERSLSADGTRLICREVVSHAAKGVLVDQFYAERLYSEAEMTVLLERAGFVETQRTQSLAQASERDQDLGMMADITVYVATAPTSRRAVPPRAPPPHDGPAAVGAAVTVILGDQSLPDPVKRDGGWNSEDLETVRRLRVALAQLDRPLRVLDDHAVLVQELRDKTPRLVLNLCDEGYGNAAERELHVPALLDLLGIAYSGAGPACLALCLDKSQVSAIAAAAGIPVPAEVYVGAGDRAEPHAPAFPAFVKPCNTDNSVGITAQSVVRGQPELVARIKRLAVELPGEAVLIQEFLAGAEYSVGIIGNPGGPMETLPLLEVDYGQLDPALPKLLDYGSKWHPESRQWTDIGYREADVGDHTRQLLEDYSLRLFERLRCRDYARFDFRAGADGQVKLLEANPNPGWCWDGKLALMFGLAGRSYADLLRAIVGTAEERIARVKLATNRRGS